MWSLNTVVLPITVAFRYLSDLTDAEWALSMIPPARRGGHRREVNINIREVLNAVFYMFSTGCQWQALPGPAAQEHGALLLHAVGLGWHAGAPPSHALCRDTRAGRARGEPDGRDDRQPEPQSRSKASAFW
jgi:hypothetical protein